jgi:hypothetical protein
MIRYRILLALAALWLLCLPLAAQAFNLDSLIEKSIGGPKGVKQLADMKSYSVYGKVLLNGQPGTYVEHVCPPNKLYLSVRLEAFETIQGYDGVTAWQTDLNGHPSELTGFEKKEIVKSAYFEAGGFDRPGQISAVRKYEGLVTRDQRGYHQVAYIFFNTDTTRILYDTASARAVYRLGNLDNTQTVSECSDFRPVGNIVIPFRSVTTATGAPLTVEFITDSVHFDQPVDPAIFTLPGAAQSSSDIRFPADASSVTIPITYRNGHIYLIATVNGKNKGEFILDSGCSATIFHLPFVASLNLPKAGSMPAKGVGGFESVDLLKTDSVTIGPVTLYRQIGGATDLSSIGRGDSLPFAGILGYDFLSRFPLLIDYQAQTITIYDPARFVPPTGGTEVPFTLTMQVPTVRASVMNASGEFIVDLGNGNGLLLHHAFVEANDLKRRLDVDSDSEHTLAGVGGGVTGTFTMVPRLDVGDFAMESLPTILFSASEGMTGSAAIAGNIGNQVLSRYRLLLDYDHHRLIFY